MAIITCSLKADGARQIAPHLQAREFASVSGGKVYSDTIKYSEETLAVLVRLRERLDALGAAPQGDGSSSWKCTATIINSGYRTPEHDRAVDGSGSGRHVLGDAVDFKIKCTGGAFTVVQDGARWVSAKLICCILQDFGVNGIGYINARSVHVDSRAASEKWWGDETKANYPRVADWFKWGGIPLTAVRLLGDVNGDGVVDSSDARTVLQHEVGTVKLEGVARAVADVNGDGVADSADARLILEREVGRG